MINEISKLISFGIPTYNRAAMLREALDYYYNVLCLVDYELLIANNASNDDTELVCAEYSNKYKNIRYFKHETNIGADANFVFLQNKSTTEYFMLLGDGVRFSKIELQKVFDILRTHKYDVVGYDYNDRSKHQFESREYNDNNEFLRKFGWYLTQMSSYVLSRKVIDYTHNRGEGLYPKSEFRYFARIFEYAAFNPIRYYWMDINSMSFSKIEKHNTWTSKKIDIWFGEFVSTILSLPPQYSIESKMACLKEASNYYFFDRTTLLQDILNGILNKDNLLRNMYGFKLLLGEDEFDYYLMMVEKSKSEIQYELSKPQHISMLKRIKRKIKKIFNYGL